MPLALSLGTLVPTQKMALQTQSCEKALELCIVSVPDSLPKKGRYSCICMYMEFWRHESDWLITSQVHIAKCGEL